jgi:hypothetical protein
VCVQELFARFLMGFRRQVVADDAVVPNLGHRTHWIITCSNCESGYWYAGDSGIGSSS